MSNNIPLEWSNIPPGLAQIYYPRVIAARQHQATGTYLAVRVIDNAGALIWYGKANYASPPFMIEECGLHAYLDQNLKILFEAGDEALEKGPPQCVLDELARPPRDRRAKFQKDRKEGKDLQKPQDASEPPEQIEPVYSPKPEKPKRVPCAAELASADKVWPEPGSVHRPNAETMSISYDGVRAAAVYRSRDKSYKMAWKYCIHPCVGYSSPFYYAADTIEEAEAKAWQEFTNPSVDVAACLPLVGTLLAPATPS